MKTRSRISAVAVIAIVALAISPTAALARTAHKKAKPLHVIGIVKSHDAKSVRVLVAQANHHTSRVVTLNVTGKSVIRLVGKRQPRRSMRAFVAGDRINVSALHSDSGLNITNANVSPEPAKGILGTIVSVSGSTFVMDRMSEHDGNHDHTDVSSPRDGTSDGTGDGGGDGTGDGGGDGEHQVTVDATQAVVTLDGAASDTTGLAAGQFVAVLGEEEHDNIFAANVFAYSTQPDTAFGHVDSLNGSTFSLTQGDGNDDSTADGDDDDSTPPPSTNVDATNASIFLNGASATAADLTNGDKAVAFGTTDPNTGTLTANLVLAFNGEDDGPCPHDGGGDGSGD